jgi:hypothetical protein
MLEERRVPSTLTVTSADDSSASSLRGEIYAAQPGDTIVFAPSLDGQTITLGSYRDLEINKNLTIQGPGAGLLAISGAIAGNSVSRVFQVDAGANVTISGLTIEGGNGMKFYDFNPFSFTGDPYDGHGGGILNLGTLTLSGCTVTGNSAGLTGTDYSKGGGIYNGGTMTLSGCTVTGNSVNSVYTYDLFYGGGIYNGGTMTLSGCTVTGNSAVSAATRQYSSGGGIFNDTQGNLTILSSTVLNNTASEGGGIFNQGIMTLSGSKVTGNTATTGGGIFNTKQGNLTILSSDVLNNTASDGADVCNLGSIKISKDSQVGQVSRK